MDYQYIEDLRALEDKKEAKARLIEYAETSGIKVKKSKGFDSLVVEIEEGFKALAAEPMPENNEGLSISDLIDADDEASGKFVAGEVKEEAKLLLDGPVSELPKVIDVPAVVQYPQTEVAHAEPIGTFELVSKIGSPVGEPSVIEVSSNTIEEAVARIQEDEKAEDELYELPANYSPSLIKIGPGQGYCTLPWWIYQWILENPDWKSKPKSFPHSYGEDTVLSLIYYIKREGSVRIRETRNSSFVILD